MKTQKLIEKGSIKVKDFDISADDLREAIQKVVEHFDYANSADGIFFGDVIEIDDTCYDKFYLTFDLTKKISSDEFELRFNVSEYDKDSEGYEQSMVAAYI